MWGEEKTPQHKKQIGVNRAVLGRSGYFRPRVVSGMSPGKMRIGQNENPLDGSLLVAKLLQFCCAQDTPADPQADIPTHTPA